MSAVHEAFQGPEGRKAIQNRVMVGLRRRRWDAASALVDRGPCQNGKNIVDAL